MSSNQSVPFKVISQGVTI